MSRTRKATPDFDPDRAVALADTYFAAAVALWSQLRRIAAWRADRGEKPGSLRDMAPAHVLEGLAIEIYLKALLKYAKCDIPRDHGLVSLFGKLPVDFQNLVQLTYDRHREETQKELNLDDRRSSVKSALRSSDNFNHEWRYFHEEGRLSQIQKRTEGFVELGVLAGALQASCHSFVDTPEPSDYTSYDDELREQLLPMMMRPKFLKEWMRRVRNWFGNSSGI